MSESSQTSRSPELYQPGSDFEFDMGSTVANTQASGKRPRHTNDSEASLPTHKELSNFGRIYSRQDDPFTTIDAIVDFGIKHQHADSVNGTIGGTNPATLSRGDHRLIHSWDLLCSIIPNFRALMLALSNNYSHSSRKVACQKIYHGVTTVRSDDTASLKTCIVSYIRADPTDSISPAISIKGKFKDDRGFCHPATASLLCPVMYPDTPETYNAILSGRLPVTTTMLPRFLFPDDHVYDPDDISKDLLRGHVMYRAAKHIFQGPSAALQGPGSHRGKQGNASICGITTMTPRTIAYVATQVRFALSSTSSWTPRDGTFSYTDFYWHIVGLLDDEDDDMEGPEIIRLYNYHVFGTEDPDHTTDTTPELVNQYDLIKQQRAAKRARISYIDN
ncbi:hypothetical protein HYPSUDRAFT_207595 [Hypholoma sublateritium FD-334 SS-4]|uniref:Fungal-type protein kinase domain-containing protein n=1 Tax=Hypholoma sublateritium (strain FD-334 SS-4) TaxID=945553 RepID=A0A0D2LXZ6_HYPSF|nr:hypothetical protein HYPSUDRAFT_207595 [Hypholoma sublateritium FD-334 SS-4]